MEMSVYPFLIAKNENDSFILHVSVNDKRMK